MKREEKQYKIVSIYDTETCNIDISEGGEIKHLAYPILFIFNDITDSIVNYKIDEKDNVHFIRTEEKALDHIKNIINTPCDYIPIICAYNLAFDIQPLLYELGLIYKIEVCAQSSSNLYYIDLYDGEKQCLRFWDTFFMDPLGLSDMGQQCGINKAVGDWDYTLRRTPETELSNLELFYAKRDVQVIPAYLKFLLDTNDYLCENDLGNHVLTKTSIVRVMAKRVTGVLEYQGFNMKKPKQTKLSAFLKCKSEQAKTYEQYAIQKACFRGGLTFTAGNYADQVVNNVASLDVTSMHHAFINGAMTPDNFKQQEKWILQRWAENITRTPIEEVLKFYNLPFTHAFHAYVKYTNLRLKENSAFKDYGIATLAAAKFSTVATVYNGDNSEAKEVAEQGIKDAGYYDKAFGDDKYPVRFAFSKLIQAAEAYVFVNEIELWIIHQVYDYDKMEIIKGEGSSHHIRPLDYVTLQSNMLYKKKAELKEIKKFYREGEEYKKDVSSLIPENIADRIKKGDLSNSFIEGYYNLTKQYLNSIYGSQAQDIHKPGYLYDGSIIVDQSEKVNYDNFKPLDSTYVMYTYGQRIVGRSRMHLIIAIILLHKKFGDDIIITGGDTDSLKVATNKSISDDDILEALNPLHEAITYAINRTMQTIRAAFPDYTDPLKDVGIFEIENDIRYPYHMEAWNKARISIDHMGKSHVTCAGVSRPSDKYNIENMINDGISQGLDPEYLMHQVLGYNTTFMSSISNLLGHHKPEYSDVIDMDIKDYKGITSHVNCHQSIALYPASKTIGEADIYKGKFTNLQNGSNVEYLRSIGHDPDLSHILIYTDETNAYILNEDTGEIKEIKRGDLDHCVDPDRC